MKFRAIQDIFLDSVEKFGAAIAIDCGEKKITYLALEERSNRLANYLLSLGVGKSSIVALLLDDRIDVVTTMLAVLKIGGVFVCLDPDLPRSRLQMMVSMLSPICFITTSRCSKDVVLLQSDAPETTFTIFLDETESGNDINRPSVMVAPDDMCYIYFTSGSTGKPKGIAGRLKAIDHFVNWEIATFQVTPSTRISQLMTPTFDAFLRDVFVPLCAGGTIHVPEGKGVTADPKLLIDFIDERQINIVHCVPSLFRSLLNGRPEPLRFASLRYVLLAGEVLLPADVKRWRTIFGDRIQLVNLYGPSETTMIKFYYFVKPTDQDLQLIPVGKPIEGARGLVVDSNGKACAPGTVGEIYIRTPYRALGYYNQPELTREAFIPNPFSHDANDIVYKTGDLGRFLRDGNLELLGRRDQQVKIRGVRVELSEIESILRSHNAVNDVVVIDRTDASHNIYLCAYIVLNEPVATSSIRTFALDHLPLAMVPTAFMTLEELPRTPSGKVDRQLLPMPDLSTSKPATVSSEPRNPIEEILVSLWGSLLGKDTIKIDENFFEAGGHSLLATQLVARLRITFGVELPLRTIFNAPTIVELASEIAKLQSSLQGLPELPLIPLKDRSYMPLSFAQQRLWFLDQLEPGSAYNVPLSARMRGYLHKAALAKSLHTIVQRHESLRTTFISVSGEPRQIIMSADAFHLCHIDLADLAPQNREAEAKRLIEGETQFPFDLKKGPLFRAFLLHLSDENHILHLNMHHIVSDAWSLGVLVHEMSTLYTAFREGRTVPLPPLPIQYADFARWQRNWLQGEILDAHIEYWKRQLRNAAPLNLPTDYPQLPVHSYHGASYAFNLPIDLSQELMILSQRENVTLFMTLLAAFQLLLYRYCHQEDIVVGTDIANRVQKETEGLIGFFVNLLVLRTNIGGKPTFRELLLRVRETVLGAYTYQNLPFELLVDSLRLERKLNRTPLVRALFVLQNVPVTREQLPDLMVTPFGKEVTTSKFDLAMFLLETPNGLRGTISYSTDLFAEQTIARMIYNFSALLEGLVQQLDVPIDLLEMSTEAEREREIREKRARRQANREDLRKIGRGRSASRERLT